MKTSDRPSVAAQPWEAFDADLDESMVQRAPCELEQQVDESLGLQMISIRLQKSLLVRLKEVARHHGIGYQPLVRDLLNRFALSEMKMISNLKHEERKREIERMEAERASQERLQAVDAFFERERKTA